MTFKILLYFWSFFRDSPFELEFGISALKLKIIKILKPDRTFEAGKILPLYFSTSYFSSKQFIY